MSLTEHLEQPASLDTWYQLPLIESHTKCTREEFPRRIHINNSRMKDYFANNKKA